MLRIHNISFSYGNRCTFARLRRAFWRSLVFAILKSWSCIPSNLEMIPVVRDMHSEHVIYNDPFILFVASLNGSNTFSKSRINCNSLKHEWVGLFWWTVEPPKLESLFLENVPASCKTNSTVSWYPAIKYVLFCQHASIVTNAAVACVLNGKMLQSV